MYYKKRGKGNVGGTSRKEGQKRGVDAEVERFERKRSGKAPHGR